MSRQRFDWEVPTGPITGLWFDGEAGVGTAVELYGHEGLLRLIRSDGQAVSLDPATLRRPPDQATPGALTYRVEGGKGRVVSDDPRAIELIEAMAPIAATPPNLPQQWKRAVQVSALGIAVLAVLVFGILPGLARVLANAMGAEAEVALGEIHFQQSREFFGEGTPLPICDNPAGVDALQAMVERVSQGVELPYDLQVVVVDDSLNPINNAYAVAGGRVTFFHSLILDAERPEEVAAVLAHEIGHVVYRDPVTGLLEGASATAIMSLLAGDVTGGGLIGGAAGQALTSSYSRKAETRADEFARAQLVKAGLPPSALGTFFDRVRAQYGDVDGVLAHFSSHPQLAARIEEANTAGDPPIGAPALTPKAWTALRGICS